MATLKQIKSNLGITELNLQFAQDLEGNKTEWLRHWDNDRRIAVSIHKDLATELAADKAGAINNLSVQFQQRSGEQGPYDAHRIVRYNATPDMVL